MKAIDIIFTPVYSPQDKEYLLEMINDYIENGWTFSGAIPPQDSNLNHFCFVKYE